MPRLDAFFYGKKVLVTGGLGFIGSNVGGRLADLDAQAVLLAGLIPECSGDLFNIDGHEAASRVNIADVRDSHGMKYLAREHDISLTLPVTPASLIRHSPEKPRLQSMASERGIPGGVELAGEIVDDERLALYYFKRSLSSVSSGAIGLSTIHSLAFGCLFLSPVASRMVPRSRC